MDTETKLRSAAATEKRRAAKLEEMCKFFRERCLQLELQVISARVKRNSLIAKDRTTYSGTELMEREVLLDSLLQELAEARADNVHLFEKCEYLIARVPDPPPHMQTHMQPPAPAQTISPPLTPPKLQAVPALDYGTRFPRNLEFGPTSSYRYDNTGSPLT